MGKVERALADWAKQPGATITDATRQFVADMRKARAAGVGYGAMQQIIEWEWQDVDEATAQGPQATMRALDELKAEIAELRDRLGSPT